MAPLFTVIIPAYNRAELLRLTLKSLAAQTFTDYEAFIIDDGSTDATPEVFEQFKGQSNWHFVRFETNRRQGGCRNYALERAAGDYATFLDADDLWLPRRLEKFAELAKRNPAAGFLFSNGYILRDGRLTGKFFDENRAVPRGKLPPYMAISDKWLPYVTTNVAFKRAALEKTGYFRQDLSHLEDMELYVKILRDWEADFIAEPLSVYRIHSLTSSPASLTLKWDDGIADFHEALKTAAPEPAAERELKDYVYLRQAEVYLKNLQPAKAREYLRKTTARGGPFFKLFAGSLLPVPALSLLRRLYALKRKAAPSPDAAMALAEAWVKELETSR
ncbi:MAG: glycosyltransferase [Elusimicrobiales bacterium]|nr:glycosyltransferase [Elusimicrobiales bacterium]